MCVYIYIYIYIYTDVPVSVSVFLSLYVEREKESQRAIDPIILEGTNQYCDFTDKETEVPGLYHFSKFLLSVK